MATFTRVLGVAFVGSALAVGCVISSDNDDGVFDDDDAGLSGDGDGDGDVIPGDGDGDVIPGDGDGDVTVDAGDGDGDVTPDGGDQNMCFAPDTSEPCGACVADHCLAEWCVCDADENCGLPGDEIVCMISCVQDLAADGNTAEDAFATCADGCPAPDSGSVVLSDATLDLIACLRAGVPDPLLADAGLDGGNFDIAVCGDECFGYLEPATE